MDGLRDSCTMWLSWGTSTTGIFSLTFQCHLWRWAQAKSFPKPPQLAQIPGQPCCKDSKEIIKWGDLAEEHQSQQLIASWSLSDSPSVLLSLPFGSRSFMEQGKVKLLLCFRPPLSTGWGTARTDPQNTLQCWSFTTSWTTETRKSGLKPTSGGAVVLIHQRAEKEPCTNHEI